MGGDKGGGGDSMGEGIMFDCKTSTLSAVLRHPQLRSPRRQMWLLLNSLSTSLDRSDGISFNSLTGFVGPRPQSEIEEALVNNTTLLESESGAGDEN